MLLLTVHLGYPGRRSTVSSDLGIPVAASMNRTIKNPPVRAREPHRRWHDAWRGMQGSSHAKSAIASEWSPMAKHFLAPGLSRFGFLFDGTGWHGSCLPGYQACVSLGRLAHAARNHEVLGPSPVTAAARTN